MANDEQSQQKNSRNPNNGPQNNQNRNQRHNNDNRRNGPNNNQPNRKNDPRKEGRAYSNARGPQPPRSDRPKNQQQNSGQQNNANNPNNQNRAPQGQGLSALLRKYDYLVDVVNAARRKLYAQYARADDRERGKLLQNYNTSLIQLRQMEQSGDAYYKEKLANRYGYSPIDEDFSKFLKEQNISLDEYYRAGAVEDYTDPHKSPSQREASYKNDNEESAGTLEDYLTVKSR